MVGWNNPMLGCAFVAIFPCWAKSLIWLESGPPRAETDQRLTAVLVPIRIQYTAAAPWRRVADLLSSESILLSPITTSILHCKCSSIYKIKAPSQPASQPPQHIPDQTELLPSLADLVAGRNGEIYVVVLVLVLIV